MKNSALKLSLVGVSVLSLTACGVTTTPLNSANKSVAQSLSQGKAMSLSNTASFSLTTIGSEKVENVNLTGAQVKILTDASGKENGYAVTIDGKSFEFETKNIQLQTRNDDTIASIFNATPKNGVEALFYFRSGITGKDGKPNSDYKYSDRYFLSTIENDNRGQIYTGVFGNKTEGALTGKIPYDGEANFSMIRDAQTHNVTANVALDVDFSTNKLVGRMYSMSDSSSAGGKPVFYDGVYAQGVIDFNATVDGNGFSGTLKSNSSLDAYYFGGLKGNLKGNFYGPDGAEVGASFTINGDYYKGAGTLQAKKAN